MKTHYTYLEPRRKNEIDLNFDFGQLKIYNGVSGIYKFSFPFASDYFSDYPIFVGKSVDIKSIIATHIREIKKIFDNLDENWYDPVYEFSYYITPEQFYNGIELKKNIAQYSKIIFYLLYTDIDLTEVKIELLEKTDNYNNSKLQEREKFFIDKELKKLDNFLKNI